VTFLLRAAAALLLVAGGGLAVHLLGFGSSYPRLDLKVVIERGNGVSEEDVLLEMYGPETPILAANGERRARPR
jgi:hypothetical protein